jgi:small-conductance mechanosensitive channel
VSFNFLRSAFCVLVALCTSILGCGRASDKDLAETRELIRQTAADTDALRKDLREALEKNNQLNQQLHDSNADAERHRKARVEAERQEAAEQEQRRAALAEAERQRAALADERERQQQTVYKPEIKIEPKIEFPSPPRKSADIIIHSVEVYSRRKNGKVWDESGPPDLKVEITNLDTHQTYATRVAEDVHSATFNSKSIRIAEGQKFKVTVWDKDVFFNDEIGSYVKEVTADTIASGKVNWTFDRIASLVLEFQP